MSLGRGGLWVSVSLVLHAALFFALDRRGFETPVSEPPPLWLEPSVTRAEPAPPLPVQPPPAPPPPAPKTPRPVREPKATAPPQLAAPEVTAPVVDGPSSVAVTEGDGSAALGSTGVPSAGGGTAATEGGGASEAVRKAGPPQLSLWLELAAVERMALARPTLGLLMAVPGYADVLRGSGIRPLIDLQRVRVRLSGVTADRLLIAGVHHEGDAAVVAAAERVAAMRDAVPEWRGDDDFRATAWVDGSASDRGLAVHGGAFVIAPRTAMPELLGAKATAERVQGVSKLRDRVLALIAIEDAPRYLPSVAACALQAVRISFADGADSPRLSLAAHYETATRAREAGACLASAATELGAQMPVLSSWLARAQAGEGGASAQLTMGVNSNDIEKLFNELAWALRSARRA
jgi:hypothetical protein